MEKNTIIIIIVLGVVILHMSLSAYIYFDGLKEKREETQNKFYSEGYEQARKDMVSNIFLRGGQCTRIPITVGNQTINMIALECLQAGGLQ